MEPRIRHILEWLAEENDCRYDHHGYCQEHYLHDKDECPVKLAKDILKEKQ